MQQALDDAASVSSMVVNGPNGERAIINSVTKYDDQDKPKLSKTLTVTMSTQRFSRIV